MGTPVLAHWQEFDAAVTGVVDASGAPTTFDGIPVWESTDEDVAGIQAAADGMSALVYSTDTDGTATVTVTGDGKHGEDVVPIVAVMTVIVSSAPEDVAVFEITAGEARDRPHVEPHE